MSSPEMGTEIRNVVVVGAGAMGSGIAQVFAMAGMSGTRPSAR
jgi:3-hydroxyacyl-CoA dehydrogenase